MCQSSFLSTNKEGNIWEVHKYPPIKYPIITRGYKM